MPQTRTVHVGVSLSDHPAAKLEIRVRPWAVVTAEGDVVEWKSEAINGQPLRVTDMQIHRQPGAGAWPFDASRPIKGKRPKSGKRKPLGGKRTGGTKVPYTILITFTDNDGNDRTALVDPDIIIPD